MSNVDLIFELEQKILNLWHVVDDIKMIRESSSDDTNELLKSLEVLYQIKFENTFKIFESVCAEYHSEKRRIESGDYNRIWREGYVRGCTDMFEGNNPDETFQEVLGEPYYLENV